VCPLHYTSICELNDIFSETHWLYCLVVERAPSHIFHSATTDTTEAAQMETIAAASDSPSRAFTSTNNEKEHIITPVSRKSHLRTNDTTKVVKIMRRGGRIVQDCDIYIGRRITRGGWNLPQSKWHNPFPRPSNSLIARREAIAKYETYIRNSPALLRSLPELEGRRLGCWCKENGAVPCHGDVLLALLRERYADGDVID
jgi:hypothetical protein